MKHQGTYLPNSPRWHAVLHRLETGHVSRRSSWISLHSTLLATKPKLAILKGQIYQSTNHALCTTFVSVVLLMEVYFIVYHNQIQQAPNWGLHSKLPANTKRHLMPCLENNFRWVIQTNAWTMLHYVLALQAWPFSLIHCVGRMWWRCGVQGLF